jgi:competence protein ComEC
MSHRATHPWDPSDDAPWWRRSLCISLVGAMVLGIAAGAAWPMLWVWIILAAVALGAAGACGWRRRFAAALLWALVAVVPLSAAWYVARCVYESPHAVDRYAQAIGQLAAVRGIVVKDAHLSSPQRGAFASFAYEPPGTLLGLRVTELRVGDAWVPSGGCLLMRLDEADYRLRAGLAIEALGWLSAFDAPVNPGEPDFRRILRDRGFDARFVVPLRANWRLLPQQPSLTLAAAVDHVRAACAAAALHSLELGMDRNGQALALMRTLLLGLQDQTPRDLRESFRDVGLAHILSISGAHLAILMGMVWVVARFFVARPHRTAMLVLAVLLLYLTAIPTQVPIIRSAIMAGLFAVGFATGRRVRALDLLALAGVIILLWRPGDLFNAGAQLSFLAVWALLAFTGPVSAFLFPPPLLPHQPRSRLRLIGHGLADSVAVSTVAFLIVTPLVLYHFGMATPWAILLSVVSLPLVTLVLGLGYFKIIVGLILPSGGWLLGAPLSWLAHAMIALVHAAQAWPAATLRFPQPPSALWTFTATALVAALLAGWFARRRLAAFAAFALCVLWLLMSTSILPATPAALVAFVRPPPAPALRLNMFAVGDGSCFLLRWADQTWMFDCGSQAHLDVGLSRITPALSELGVQRLDAVFLSHADLDHYGGILDVMDAVEVGQILAPPQLIAQGAQGEPNAGAAAFLLAELTRRGKAAAPVSRGWSRRIGQVQLDLLWPPADRAFRRTNDGSLCLSVRVAGRRVLLNGDLQQESMTAIFDLNEDLDADVADLPHHGSFVEASPAWLQRVSPKIVLQSSGRHWRDRDRWAHVLKDTGIERLITNELGMVELTIAADGAIAWRGTVPSTVSRQ